MTVNEFLELVKDGIIIESIAGGDDVDAPHTIQIVTATGVVIPGIRAFQLAPVSADP